MAVDNYLTYPQDYHAAKVNLPTTAAVLKLLIFNHKMNLSLYTQALIINITKIFLLLKL